MQSSDEKTREILDLRDRVAEKIEDHERETEFLRKNLEVLDSVLKRTSFTKASSIHRDSKPPDSIPITNGADGDVIANAYVTPEQVSIVLGENMVLNPETPPFKSFFVDRIIGEMQRSDAVQVRDGKIQKDAAIDFVINKNGANIREIIIKNYRQQERIKEIISTAGWSLTRMLENLNK